MGMGVWGWEGRVTSSTVMGEGLLEDKPSGASFDESLLLFGFIYFTRSKLLNIIAIINSNAI